MALAADDPVKDRFKSSKSRADWSCDNVDVSVKENRIQCRGHAYVKREDFTLKCDILEVLTDDKHNLKRAVCIENVFMKTAEGEMRSEKADYDAGKEVVVLSGNPRLKRGDSEFSFDVMSYDLKNERVRGSRAKGTVAPEQKPVGQKPPTGKPALEQKK